MIIILVYVIGLRGFGSKVSGVCGGIKGEDVDRVNVGGIIVVID